MKLKITCITFFLFVVICLKAEIKIASVLGDNMVLQRNTDIKIWGKADPNQKIKVHTSWNNIEVSTTSNKQGEWLVKVKTTEAGGPYSIVISAANEKVSIKNILLGEVWLCSGQSNMEMQVAGGTDMPILNSNDIILNADNENIRLFTMQKASKDTPQDTCVGNWTAASSSSVATFSAVGYLFAKQLHKKLDMPIGIISSNWGGSKVEAWMDLKTIAKFPEALKRTSRETTIPSHKAGRLYNGMIAPITNFTIKGVLWYQGEANVDDYNDYAALQAAMVANWRNDFGIGDFPFYFVQVSPYYYRNSKGVNAALFRDAQLKSMSMIPNSGMVCTLDIGEERNVHPPKKETVAKRLAYWAFAKTYGVKNIVYKSPTYKSMTVTDSVALIAFNDVGLGLSTFGKEVECFEIAGEDRVFYPAKMTIKNKQVLVWSPQVKEPVAVRYGFYNFPKTEGYLYGVARLPVPSFRTDNW